MYVLNAVLAFSGPAMRMPDVSPRVPATRRKKLRVVRGVAARFPALGYYNASKYAVEGLSEALWQEVEPLGIKVMLVEPSGFRTDWAGRSAGESSRNIEDYKATAGASRKRLRADSGRQPGDPVRAALAIIQATESKQPPHRLLLGSDAYDGAVGKLEQLRSEFQHGEAVSRPIL